MNTLAMWTVYGPHTADYPGEYIARKFLMKGGDALATPEVLRAPDLTSIRETLASMGMIALTRAPGDDPVIIETWL